MKNQKSNLIVKPLCNKLKLITLILLLISTSLHADFTGGDGTEANPYQISTIEQLNEVRDFVDKNFILTNDLDFLDTPYDSTNSVEHKGWEPIKDFAGIFDGAGHIIDNLYIMQPAQNLVGLFANTISGKIKNLGLTNVKVNGKINVGGIVGSGGGRIDLCYVIGSVNGSENVGGIAGYSISIKNSYSNGNVNGYRYVGGIAGYSSSEISGCYSNSSVVGYEYVGGILGFNNHYDYIENCDEIGYVSGMVRDSYATGSVTGHNYVGGLIGYNLAAISSSYANNNSITIKTDDTISKKKYSGTAVDDCSYWTDEVYYNGQNINIPSVLYDRGSDSLSFRDSSRIHLYYVDPNGTESGFIFNPDGFPYLSWQDPESLPLSIKKYGNQSALNLKFDYQNNLLDIVFNKSQRSTVSIYSLTGKLILSKHHQSSQITQDLSHLNSSIYIVKVTSLNGSYSEKVLVE